MMQPRRQLPLYHMRLLTTTTSPARTIVLAHWFTSLAGSARTHAFLKFARKLVLCRGPESNWRHMVLQTIALPTELPRRETDFTLEIERSDSLQTEQWSRGLSPRPARRSELLSTRSPKPLLRIAVSKLGDHGVSYTMCPAPARI